LKPINYRFEAHYCRFEAHYCVKGFISGEVYGLNMGNSSRRIGQRQTRQVRASIKTFLRKKEFAHKKEILQHIILDDSLALSRAERMRVAVTVMRMPVFSSFNTANLVEGIPHLLWAVNEAYEEFNPLKKD